MKSVRLIDMRKIQSLVVKKIQKLDWYDYIERVISAFIKRNINFYFVGGITRDFLIQTIEHKSKMKNSEIPHIADVDIVVELTNFNDLQQIIKTIKFKTKFEIIEYPNFLTSSILLTTPEKNYRIDFSIPRKEVYSSSGSLPTVSVGNILEDLFRRDFTINAIALRYDYGKNTYIFFDPYHGIKDLLNKKIRVLHDRSFYDDPTRIIRAIQFSARLRFDIEEKTMKYMKQAISDGMLTKISQTRLVNEFVNILKKGENLYLIAETFKKYGIVEFYEFIKEIMEAFIKNCRDIELSQYRDISYEERFYIRLLFLLEKVCGEVKLGEKSKISQFRNYLVKLNLPKKQREPIYTAVEYFSTRKVKKTIYPWLKLYSTTFSRSFPL